MTRLQELDIDIDNGENWLGLKIYPGLGMPLLRREGGVFWETMTNATCHIVLADLKAERAVLQHDGIHGTDGVSA